jgi:hypothetical protein
MRGRKPRPLNIDPEDIPRLRRIARNAELPWSHVRLARVVLAIADGERVQDVAERIQCDPATVWRIAREFEQRGMQGFGPMRERRRTSRPQELEAGHATDSLPVVSSPRP